MKVWWLVGLALTLLVPGGTCLAQEQEEPPTIASTVDGFASVDSMIRMLTVVEDTLKRGNIDPAQRLFSCNVEMAVYHEHTDGRGGIIPSSSTAGFQTYLTVHVSADDFVTNAPALFSAVGAPVKQVGYGMAAGSEEPEGLCCGFEWGPQVNYGPPFVFQWNIVGGTKDLRVDQWYRSLPKALRNR